MNLAEIVRVGWGQEERISNFRREAEKNLKLSPLDPKLQAQFPSQIHENLASQSVISI